MSDRIISEWLHDWKDEWDRDMVEFDQAIDEAEVAVSELEEVVATNKADQ